MKKLLFLCFDVSEGKSGDIVESRAKTKKPVDSLHLRWKKLAMHHFFVAVVFEPIFML